MDGIQISSKNKLELITKKEIFDSVNSVKLKMTKVLFTQEDFHTLLGDAQVNLPIIPGRVGIGKITELSGEETLGFERGARVFPHPEISCGVCSACSKNDETHCSSLLVAGKTTDGFLRDFAILSKDDVSILPNSVNDYDALFINHISLCINVIDALNFQKGDHVIIVGADVLGIILAQLVVYYQGVPIIVDNNENNIILAKNAGIYYTIFSDNKVEKNVIDITGARLSTKVVYMTGSNLNTDIALKLAGHNATVCFSGFATPSIKVNFNTALTKQLNFTCVTNAYGNIDSAINILANKAIDTSIFTISQVRRQNAVDNILELSKQVEQNATSKMLIVDVE